MRRRQRHHDGTTTTENWTRSWSWKSYLAIWLYGPPTSGIRFDCRQQFRNFSLVNPPFREPLAGTLSLALSRGEFTRELLTRQVGARVSLSVMSGFSYFMCNFNTYYKLTALINVSVCVSVQLPLYICVSPPPLGITCSYSCFGQTLSNNIVLHIHKIQLFMLAGCFFRGRVCVFMEMCVGSSPLLLSKKKQFSLHLGMVLLLLHRQIGTNHFLLHTLVGGKTWRVGEPYIA